MEDEDIYGGGSDRAKYNATIEATPARPEEEDEDVEMPAHMKHKRNFTAPKNLVDEAMKDGDDVSGFADYERQTIMQRESAYKSSFLNRELSPTRHDPFADGGKTPAANTRTYADVRIEQNLEQQAAGLKEKIRKEKEELEKAGIPVASASSSSSSTATGTAKPKRKRRWDMAAAPAETETADSAAASVAKSRWEGDDAEMAAEWSAGSTHDAKRNRWDAGDQTPAPASTLAGGATPAVGQTPGGTKRKRSRWDNAEATPSTAGAATPMHYAQTPVGTQLAGLQTPSVAQAMAGTQPVEQAPTDRRWARELEYRNRPLSDEDLDAMFPAEGYEIMSQPTSYVPFMTPHRKLMQTPSTVSGATPGFTMQGEEDFGQDYGVLKEVPGMPDVYLKPEDMQYFSKVLENVDEQKMSAKEITERKIMQLLLKIKNGTPPMRKAALRQITDRAREFGAEALFNKILALLRSTSLEDQERHLLVKVMDRILYKLDDLVRPFVHKILIVVEPMLIEEDKFARIEGREIISNLAKAAGMATMVSTMRTDIDHEHEFVRNTTARAFAVVASALGIPTLLPFLKAVCKSKKSWQAAHTGIKICQQIAILMGCAILPHLKSLVDIIGHGLKHEQQKVRTITALSLAALAEAATPYGIESFDNVLFDLFQGIRTHRGKGLGAFLKAIGFIIPLMDEETAPPFVKDVMVVLVREFATQDEEMKKIVLKVIKQCACTDGVTAAYIREEMLPEFFKHFWVVRMASDTRNYRELVSTTVELANKVGVSDIIERVVDGLKNPSEDYRKMVIEAIEKIMSNLGASDIEPRLEERLMDGILSAFREQAHDDWIVLNGFGVIVNTLNLRAKPYLAQICGVARFRLNSVASKVRQQAADLISRIAVVMETCGESQLLSHLGLILYENLGEEYPDVLGSILGALRAIVNVIGMEKMNPPIGDLLPRLTPILRNRHEKVQENCIDLVGRIADRGADAVSPKEWIRICFELLELLKAHKKAIRRATVNTFGYIAKAIGPHDVLATLLNNLKVQERQNRVCTTVAIAIVAETCAPFTVLPALMNEYRVPELNVQNGVLKSLSFMFEYIGEMAKDYIYAVTPLLEDALIDRDQVHRQTACTTIKHLALGVWGFGTEDALQHLLNFVWPNIFEQSPHVINACLDAVDGLRVALGPQIILYHVLSGLFHPARRVRDVYWKIYNSLYVGSQDAIIAAYPEFEDTETNTYHRAELAYVF